MSEHTPAPWCAEIDIERHRQDLRWGGPAHDRAHTEDEWDEIIERLSCEALTAAQDGDQDGFDHLLVQMMAVAVARKEAKP